MTVSQEIKDAARTWAHHYTIGYDNTFVCQDQITEAIGRPLTRTEHDWLTNHIEFYGSASVIDE